MSKKKHPTAEQRASFINDMRMKQQNILWPDTLRNGVEHRQVPTEGVRASLARHEDWSLAHWNMRVVDGYCRSEFDPAGKNVVRDSCWDRVQFLGGLIIFL